MGTTERSLSQDLVFDILSSPRRRYVLYYLRQVDEPIELTALAEQVAAWENQTDTESLSDQQRKRVYVSLYQTHVPKLDDAGVVRYDQDEGTVELAPDATAIDDYLTQSSTAPSWERIYLALAAVGGLFLALTLFDVSLFAALSEVVVALVVVAAFVVTSLAHTLSFLRTNGAAPPELRRQK